MIAEPMTPDLDNWLPRASLRVRHERHAAVEPERLWQAARTVRLSDAGMLGRLVRWRIPGVRPDIPFDELFRQPPFTVLEAGDRALVSGLVGKIWTLHRDYPALQDPDRFRTWSVGGTVRVLFANWVEPVDAGGATLVSESRIAAVGVQGRIGLAAVRPLVAASHNLVASEGIEAAIRRVR